MKRKQSMVIVAVLIAVAVAFAVTRKSAPPAIDTEKYEAVHVTPEEP